MISGCHCGAHVAGVSLAGGVCVCVCVFVRVTSSDDTGPLADTKSFLVVYDCTVVRR